MTVSPWFASVARGLAERPKGSAAAVVFPAYRPDLVAALAADLGLRLVDFRRERMVPLGWHAASLPLSVLTEHALAAMEDHESGILLQNAEALLAVHGPQARADFFADILTREWPARLVLPVCLYAASLPADHPGVLHLQASDLPAETLLLRLASLT